MSECRDRLTADLMRFYQVRLSDVEAGREDALEVANMVAYMPSGGALGGWFGGELALSDEVHALRELTFTVAQVNSKKRLSMPPLPEGAKSQEERLQSIKRNARRFRKRRNRRGT